MKVTLMFFLFSLSLFGQETAAKLEEEAYAMYDDGDKLHAVQKFIELHEKYPNAENDNFNFYNIPILYEEIDSISLAIKWYNEILKSDIKDHIQHFEFPDTHTNFKHKSAINLAEIYYNAKNYPTALKYYYMALNDFPYYSSSGTSKKKNDVSLRRCIADCYEYMGQPDNVIRILLSDAITASPWFENPTANYLAEYIGKKANKKEFLKKFDKALSSVKLKDNYPFLFISGEEVKIIPYGETYESPKAFIKAVKEGRFYHLLSE